jgi:multiple RNA-binding domain-containing protein 1
LKEENVSAKSKLWANENDTTVVSNDGNNQATLNKETNATSIANHAILSDTQVVGLPNNSESNKSRELKRDGVMSDTDYFQSRVTTEWSDSESCDDENDNVNSDSESADDDDKDNRSPASEHEENCGNNPSERNPRSGAQELDLEGQEDTFGENVANANDKYSQVTATEEEEKSSNPKVKKEVSESCRLFVRNLPYTTTYFLKLSYGYMFHSVLPAFPFIIFLLNECLLIVTFLCY